MTKLCCLNQDNHISVRASCRWKCTGSLRWTMSCPQTFQNWTHWTATSEAPCWKSIMNSSQRLRRRMSWKWPCRPSGKNCHKNTSTVGDQLHQVLDCLHGCDQWWSLRASAVTVCLQVCMLNAHLIASKPALFRANEPTSQTNELQINARNAEKWGDCLG